MPFLNVSNLFSSEFYQKTYFIFVMRWHYILEKKNHNLLNIKSILYQLTVNCICIQAFLAWKVEEKSWGFFLGGGLKYNANARIEG